MTPVGRVQPTMTGSSRPGADPHVFSGSIQQCNSASLTPAPRSGPKVAHAFDRVAVIINTRLMTNCHKLAKCFQ